MPGSVASMAVQKKQSVVAPSQGPLQPPRTTDTYRRGNGHERGAGNGLYPIKSNPQAKKAAFSLNRSNQVCNTVSPRPTAVANGLHIDERLRAARERREEQQRLLASREQSRLEREQRARRYHEQQVEERKKKLLEVRLKEDRRRAAVEEKRRQTLREERERHELAVRRTQEKSQKAQQGPAQNPRGRKTTKSVPRRLPLTTWERNLVGRLLTPTCSYLARSKSAGCQSGEEVSFHSMNTTPTPPKPQHHLDPVRRRPPASPSPNSRGVHPQQVQKTLRQQDAVKSNSNRGSNVRSTGINTSVKPAPVTQSRKASPSPDRSPRRSVSRHSTPIRIELPSVPEEDAAICSPAVTSARGQRERTRTEKAPAARRSFLPDTRKEAVTRTVEIRSPPLRPLPPVPQPPEAVSRPTAGTTDREEASRLLAERRREARLQREKEEQERLEKEEAERRRGEELECRRSEERARQQAEAQRLVEEKRRREEEEQRRAEEERAQAMMEAALLHRQREEEQAREREEAGRMKQERDMLAQKEDADRLARKKRLEEIMRRTRRADSPDARSAPVRILPNQAQPKENAQPAQKGTIEHVVKLSDEEDVVPVVAFKERRSLRTLAGLEKIQSHQRAEVI